MMPTHLESHKLSSFMSHFKNASLVNGKGELLFSKDSDSFKTTTSRLVIFQIAKKYLSLNPGDIIISNDPENGGTDLTRVYFVASLSTNLFVVWDAEFHDLKFKIPLTPLIEKNVKNPFVWAALVDSQPNANQFKAFFEGQIEKITAIQKLQKYIEQLTNESFQKSWFKICKSIFEDHFQLKSFGQHAVIVPYRDQQIKLATAADEKQNVKSFKIDLSGTSLADKFSVASHVVESGLMIEVSKFYNLEKFLSQPILDHVKLLLPPKSVVSKAHPTGEFNFEVQKLTRQMMRHCLQQMNTQTKKSDKKFTLYTTFNLLLLSQNRSYSNFLSNSRVQFHDSNLFEKTGFQYIEQEFKAQLKVTGVSATTLKVSGIRSTEDSEKRWIKLNGEFLDHGTYQLKENDELSFNWKI